MENALMSDLDQFRRETRTWLEANCPPEMRRPMTSDEDTFWGGRNTKFSSEPQRIWFERMRDKRWTVPHWPKEYGGGGLDPEQTKIVRQEMAALGARQPLGSFAGARAIPSRMPDRTSRHCRPALKATATTSSSTVRKSGPLMRISRTGFSVWCGLMRPPRSMTASVLFCSTWLQKAF